MVKGVNYDAIFQRAHEIANQRIRSGEPVLPDDTVCVLSTGSDKLFTGLNHREQAGGSIRNIHAEVEAIRNMQAAGESHIRTLLLISTANGMPMLPCDNCMMSIIALNPENNRCEIMMMDRAVPISEFIDKLRPMGRPLATPGVNSVTSVSVQVRDATNDANLLKSRVNSLLDSIEDEADEDDAKPQKKKRFGGLFKKK